MAALNEQNVQRKFANVNNTQDAIQSLSLWVLHHKAHHERIVELWFKALKKAKISHRLTLFYICNEIVQTCRRKHAIMYKDAFKEVLKDAVLLVRDPSIRPNVGRILKIWEERTVYDAEFMDEILSMLNNVKTSSTLNSKLLAEFQPSVVMDKIRSFRKFELEIEKKRSQLSTIRLDASSLEAIKQLKDRAHGKEFSQNFEDSCVKLEEYVHYVEQEIRDRAALIESLEETEVFYDAQYGEAKIVANAYKNFGQRVNNQRKKIDEHKKGLPSPIPSPSHDAPSPGNTPPHIAQQYDNTDTVDMDLSDDEDKKGKGKKSSIEHGLPDLAAGAKGSFMKAFSGGSGKGGLPSLDGGDNTPTKDEGSGTPTMDENEGATPMNFLTQLISQSQKEQKGSTDFFASLTNLTSNLKGKYGDDKEEPKEPRSWAAWKAKKEVVITPPQESTPPPPKPSPPSPPRVKAVPPQSPLHRPPPSPLHRPLPSAHHGPPLPPHQAHAPPPETQNTPPPRGMSPPVAPPLPQPPLPPHHTQQAIPPAHFTPGPPPQSPAAPPPGPQQTPRQPPQLMHQPPPNASSPPDTPTSVPPGMPPMNQSYPFPPPGPPGQMPGMPPGPPLRPPHGSIQTSMASPQQQHGMPPPMFSMPPPSSQPGMPPRAPPGLPPPPQPPPGMMGDPRLPSMNTPPPGMAPPILQGGMRPRMDFPPGGPQGPPGHGPPLLYQQNRPPPPHGPPGHSWPVAPGPFHGSSAMAPPMPPSDVAAQPTSPQQGSSPTNPFEANGPRLGGPLNQGPRNLIGDSENNGQSGRPRLNSGGSSGASSDKPSRRLTSESAGLLDATEEFIASLQRKTSSSSSGTVPPPTASNDAMDMLNQLLFAHTSGSKLFPDADSPTSSSTSSQQTKETEFRPESCGMNPSSVGNDESRSPIEPPKNDNLHQSSGIKSKELRAQEEHPPRAPAPRRLDPGDEVFDRPVAEVHGTKRSADHSSRRRDDRYDRYDRERRDYYDRYDDRHDTRYDDRYDRDRYHEQYGSSSHPPQPKRLPLPPPPPPRPRF